MTPSDAQRIEREAQDLAKYFDDNGLWDMAERAQLIANGVARLRVDAERLEWLEHRASEGGCPGLIYDDNGHWAVAEDGQQTVPEGNDGWDVWTAFFVPKDEWTSSVREAIDAARAATAPMRAEKEDGRG